MDISVTSNSGGTLPPTPYRYVPATVANYQRYSHLWEPLLVLTENERRELEIVN